METFYEIGYFQLTPEKFSHSEGGRVAFYKTKEATEKAKLQLEREDKNNPPRQFNIHEHKFND